MAAALCAISADPEIVLLRLMARDKMRFARAYDALKSSGGVSAGLRISLRIIFCTNPAHD